MIDQISRWFDDKSPHWHPSDETNDMFLQTVQAQANHMLQKRGHLLLNDVYEILGLEPTAPASVLGWSQQVNNETFIEFEMVRMAQGRIAVDFNVDGVVFHEIGRKP